MHKSGRMEKKGRVRQLHVTVRAQPLAYIHTFDALFIITERSKVSSKVFFKANLM